MIEQALRAVLSGIPIGLQLGATGTGGAILGMPLMVYIAGMSMQQAAAMSLMIVATSSLVGAWEYGRRGLVKTKAAAAFSWTGMVGSWGGAFGHRLIREEVLLVLFGLLLLLVRGIMARQQRPAVECDDEESCATRFPRTCWVKVGAIGLAVGTVNGLFGVGGGFMVVPALILVLKFPARAAIGTSLMIIALISLGGVVGHLQFGHLDWNLLAYVLLGSVTGMLLGVRAGSWLPPAVMGRVTASVTISIALILIVVNASKLWRLQG
ncbi:sulfite exporter TauE/SafE family protein [Candidatus Nomurabacteria bacterium]|nr:sulfite exporter TauE/SafE family protein [Candidatus Nomurabacteria bacterium]